MPSVLTVSQLNQTVSACLDDHLDPMWISGEISSFTQAASGHCYFVLKDDRAAVRAVMFRSKAMGLSFRPRTGAQVEVLAQATLYQAKGEFQLVVQQMRPAGRGDLYAEFERIKSKLQQEGLLDASRKRLLPRLPQRLGIITSLQAAALQDVLTTLKRRAPHLDIYLYPALVQGTNAAASMMEALAQAMSRRDVDVLLLVRGGGSMEDLWCFNDEALARLIAACELPIISGVGHETDFTIADFVADVRAPTPTAAAELVTEPIFALRQRLQDYAQTIPNRMRRLLDYKAMTLDSQAGRLLSPKQLLGQALQSLRFAQSHLQQSIEHFLLQKNHSLQWQQKQIQYLQPSLEQAQQRLTSLEQRLQQLRQQALTQTQGLLEGQKQTLNYLGQRLQHHMRYAHQWHTESLQTLRRQLQALSPNAVLQRGYAIVYDEQGQVVTEAQRLAPEQRLRLQLQDAQRWVTVDN